MSDFDEGSQAGFEAVEGAAFVLLSKYRYVGHVFTTRYRRRTWCEVC